MSELRKLMTSSMITVSPRDSVREAARRMAANRVGAVLVVEADHLVGLLSERDVVQRVVEAGLSPDTTEAGRVASREVVSVDVNDSIRTVLAVFRDRRFRHLPVLDGGRPVGILSTRDFLAFLVDGLERFVEERKFAEEMAAGEDPYDHLGGAYGN